MHEPTPSPASPGGRIPSRRTRAARMIRCVIEHDRRTWNSLVRQMAAEAKWFRKSIKDLLRPPHGE